MSSPRKAALPASNQLLALLPGEDRKRLLARCERIELVESDVLCERGQRTDHVYFPVEGYISLITLVDRRDGLEVGLVGAEGMLGTSLALGVEISSQQALVQGPGFAMRIGAAGFRRELARSDPLRRLLGRYIHVLMAQMAQAGACTRFHLLEARVARWLLMTLDRCRGDSFHLTQSFLACMLGMRRVGITNVAGALQRRKLISYARGIVTVLDRRGLEAASCGCYRVDRDAYTAVLGG